MASIQKVGNNYKISVVTGRNANNNPMRKSMTYRPDQTLSEEKQLEEARYQAKLYEEKVKLLLVDANIKFAEFAQICIDEKRTAGNLTEKTYARYVEMLRRINKELGNVKMTDITTRHLRNLYSGMRSDVNGYTESCYIATDACRNAMMGVTIAYLANKSGVSDKTIRRARNGERVWRTSAAKLADALGMTLEEAFRVDRCAKKPLSEKTIKEHHNLISGVMEYAVEEELIDRNPARSAWRAKRANQKDNRNQKEPLTADELQTIAAASKIEPLKWQCIIRLLIEIGERRGAILGIKLTAIDTVNCTIRVRDTILAVNGKIYEKSSPKNKRSDRDVVILPSTMRLIERLITEREQLRIANGDRWHETGYLFTQQNGLPMHPDSVNDFLTKFSRKNGFRHLHPHLFRHSLTSLLTSNGMSIAAVARAIGDTTETISRYYDHGYDDSSKVARDLLGRLLDTDN